VFFPTGVALREAVAVMAALAGVDGTAGLAVCGGEVGLTLQGLWRKGGADITQGGQGRRPCMRALRRS
jgi:hypothetical protein